MKFHCIKDKKLSKKNMKLPMRSLGIGLNWVGKVLIMAYLKHFLDLNQKKKKNPE